MKTYTNGEITVTWEPEKCIHSAICIQGLPQVFDVNKRPWISIEQSDSARIIEQIEACPSGALGYSRKEEIETRQSETPSILSIKILPNGPILIEGGLQIEFDQDVTHRSGKTSLCRCGSSRKKPYCDGSHRALGNWDSHV